MVSTTYLGHAGICGVALLLGLAAVHFVVERPRGRKTVLFLSTVLVLLFAFTRASISHAAQPGAFSLPVWVEWAHLLSVSVWVGVVAVSGWGLLPSVALDRPAGTDIAPLLAAMSRTATAALVAVLVTGTYNTYRGVGTPDNLTGNPYANVLLIKLGLVAAAIAMGAYNRYVGIPASASSTHASVGLARVITVLRIESFVLLGVLVAAAVLTTLPPPILN